MSAQLAGDVWQALQDTEAAAAAGDHEFRAGIWAVDGGNWQRPGVHSRLHAVGAPHPRMGHLAHNACCRLHRVQHLICLHTAELTQPRM